MRRARALALVLLWVLASGAPGRAQSDTLQVVQRGVAVIQNPSGFGSAWVIHRQGLVVTAAHVVGSARSVKVTIPGYRSVNGDVVAAHRADDVAIIAVAGLGNEPVGLRLYEGVVSAGDEVFAFGFLKDAANYHLAMTKGIVSKVYGNLYQIDASLRPGFSGGPVTNRGGRVLGMASFGLSPSGNFNFVVPLDRIMRHAAPFMSTQAAGSTQTPGGGLAFYLSGNDYLDANQDVQLATLAGVLDALSYQATVTSRAQLSLSVSRCVERDTTLGQVHGIVDRFLQGRPDEWERAAAGLIVRAVLSVCRQSSGAPPGLFFYDAKDYRDDLDEDAQVWYVGGVHDGFSVQASLDPGVQPAARVVGCVSDDATLNDVHAVVGSYLGGRPELQSRPMARVVASAILDSCR